MAEILITGGAGNLGRMLASALREKGHHLSILDLASCDFGFFEDWENARVFKGDITDPAVMREALDQAEWLYHLAAILPPASERNRELTFKVNVEGTRNLIEACAASNTTRKVVFASSISLYGDTTGETKPVGIDHPVAPIDIYAETKVECEKLLQASGVPYVNLRIAGIAIPAFMDPPEPWPFTQQQRIELVPLDDLVRAMAVLPDREEALGKTLIIAGGKDWQITGQEYVRRWGEIMDMPLEEMRFRDTPGWMNWFDTETSQRLLDYQQTTLDDFFSTLQAAVDEALA